MSKWQHLSKWQQIFIWLSPLTLSICIPVTLQITAAFLGNLLLCSFLCSGGRRTIGGEKQHQKNVKSLAKKVECRFKKNPGFGVVFGFQFRLPHYVTNSGSGCLKFWYLTFLFCKMRKHNSTVFSWGLKKNIYIQVYAKPVSSFHTYHDNCSLVSHTLDLKQYQPRVFILFYRTHL